MPSGRVILDGAKGGPTLARRLEVGAVDDGRRLDRFLAQLDAGLPTSLVRRLLRQRRVRVNGRRVRQPDHSLRAGDRIEIHHDFAAVEGTADLRSWSGSVPPVLFRDDAWLVVNKPAGVACSDDGEDPAALAVWLNAHLADEIARGRARPEPCHRLDRGTTGAVAVALTPQAFDRFRRGLASGAVRKTYEVVVSGLPAEEEFACAVALDRAPRAGRHEPRMVPGDRHPAETRFRVLRSNGAQTLLEAEPVTGRTHQIRAHCRALGLPVVGDPRYGDPTGTAPTSHQLLHARRLTLDGPEGFSVEAPWLPPELEVLRGLGLGP